LKRQSWQWPAVSGARPGLSGLIGLGLVGLGLIGLGRIGFGPRRFLGAGGGSAIVSFRNRPKTTARNRNAMVSIYGPHPSAFNHTLIIRSFSDSDAKINY
jgi:hypothetical protein